MGRGTRRPRGRPLRARVLGRPHVPSSLSSAAMTVHPAQMGRQPVVLVTSSPDMATSFVLIMRVSGLDTVDGQGVLVMPAAVVPDYDPDRPARVELSSR